MYLLKVYIFKIAKQQTFKTVIQMLLNAHADYDGFDFFQLIKK